MPDDLRRYQPPTIPEPPEPEMLEDEGEEQPRESEGKTVWVGAPDAPRQASDGISDLFETGSIDESDDLRVSSRVNSLTLRPTSNG